MTSVNNELTGLGNGLRPARSTRPLLSVFILTFSLHENVSLIKIASLFRVRPCLKCALVWNARQNREKK